MKKIFTYMMVWGTMILWLEMTLLLILSLFGADKFVFVKWINYQFGILLILTTIGLLGNLYLNRSNDTIK